MGLIVACAVVVLRITTSNGTIVIENVPDDAIVEIDGDKATVTPKIGEPLHITAHAGKHAVVVKRGDLVLMGESVTVESAKQFKLTVRYEHPAEPRIKGNGESGSLRVGTVWTTTGRDGKVYTFTLLEREGDEFKAHYEGQTFSHIVRGTIRDGAITWHGRDTKVMRGTAGHDNFGTIKGDEIFVTYSREGFAGSGSYILRPKTDEALPEETRSVEIMELAAAKREAQGADQTPASERIASNGVVSPTENRRPVAGTKKAGGRRAFPVLRRMPRSSLGDRTRCFPNN